MTQNVNCDRHPRRPLRARTLTGTGPFFVCLRNQSFFIGVRYDQVLKVRDLIRKLESAGWVLPSTRGSHRQFKHPQKPSVITVAGHPGKDVPIGTLRAILKATDLEGD